MPHDKYGQLLNEGDEVILRCKITQVSPGVETACNVSAEPIERPEGEAYIPCIVGNSKFYEKAEKPTWDEGARKIAAENTAGVMYTAYCKAVGGTAFNGDPLPDWKEFRADPSKQKQSGAWVATAEAVI